jgi:hypothetical protein
MVYFTLALWLFRGRNCGYGQVMTKLADDLYHQRNAADLLEHHLDPDDWVDAGNGRRWRQPDIPNLSRGRGRHGPGPLHNLFLQVKGPIGEEGDPGVLCCGLRVISVEDGGLPLVDVALPFRSEVFVVHIGIHVVTAAAPMLTELAKDVTDPDEGE